MFIIENIISLYVQFYEFFWAIGFFGWQISVLYTTYVLYFININYSILFFILFLLSGLFNKLIKELYYSPRPKNCTKFLVSDVCMKGTNGMPSGHTQITTFALTTAYLFTHKYLYSSIALFLITFIQRIVYKNHTILQLFVGSIVGFLLGWMFYELIQMY